MDKALESCEKLLQEAQAQKHACLVGALIVNPEGFIFVQKRSANRELFPNCWGIAGGHIEEGESLSSALEREIFEETGWELSSIIALIDIADWTNPNGATCREFSFLVEVKGDLTSPRLETTKVSSFRGVTPDKLEVLKENRSEVDHYIYALLQKAFKVLKS